MKAVPCAEEILALIGHRFPGGHYTIEHWENALLTGCTGAGLLPDHIAHPVALFHVPILGANTSIAEMFSLGQAESDLSIIPESYDWQIFQTIKKDINYRIAGAIVAAERHYTDGGQMYDRVQFQFDLFAPDESLSARSTITWQYTRNML